MAISLDEVGQTLDGPTKNTHGFKGLAFELGVVGRLDERPTSGGRKNRLKSMIRRWTTLGPYGEALAVQRRAPAGRRVVKEKTKCPFKNYFMRGCRD